MSVKLEKKLFEMGEVHVLGQVFFAKVRFWTW